MLGINKFINITKPFLICSRNTRTFSYPLDISGKIHNAGNAGIRIQISYHYEFHHYEFPNQNTNSRTMYCACACLGQKYFYNKISYLFLHVYYNMYHKKIKIIPPVDNVWSEQEWGDKPETKSVDSNV